MARDERADEPLLAPPRAAAQRARYTNPVRWIWIVIIAPVLELACLVWLGRRFGLADTILLLLASAVVGSLLLRHEGTKVLRSFRNAFERFEPPEHGVVNGLLVLASAGLLIFPGVLSDMLGLALLVPWVRERVAQRIRTAVDRRLRDAQFAASPGEMFHVETRDEVATSPHDTAITTVGEALDDEHDGDARALPPRRVD